MYIVLLCREFLCTSKGKLKMDPTTEYRARMRKRSTNETYRSHSNSEDESGKRPHSRERANGRTEATESKPSARRPFSEHKPESKTEQKLSRYDDPERRTEEKRSNERRADEKRSNERRSDETNEKRSEKRTDEDARGEEVSRRKFQEHASEPAMRISDDGTSRIVNYSSNKSSPTKGNFRLQSNNNIKDKFVAPLPRMPKMFEPGAESSNRSSCVNADRSNNNSHNTQTDSRTKDAPRNSIVKTDKLEEEQAKHQKNSLGSNVFNSAKDESVRGSISNDDNRGNNGEKTGSYGSPIKLLGGRALLSNKDSMKERSGINRQENQSAKNRTLETVENGFDLPSRHSSSNAEQDAKSEDSNGKRKTSAADRSETESVEESCDDENLPVASHKKLSRDLACGLEGDSRQKRVKTSEFDDTDWERVASWFAEIACLMSV